MCPLNWIKIMSSSSKVIHILSFATFILMQDLTTASESNVRFTMGYLTGSQRKPGDNVYSRPGQVISGAISYAVDQINQNHRLINNATIDFLIAETYGSESESIRQTARLWTEAKVSAYIGPQETCVHEARMAASFNLPMISYVSICQHVVLLSSPPFFFYVPLSLSRSSLYVSRSTILTLRLPFPFPRSFFLFQNFDLKRKVLSLNNNCIWVVNTQHLFHFIQYYCGSNWVCNTRKEMTGDETAEKKEGG